MNRHQLDRFFLVALALLGFAPSASFAVETKDPFMEIAEELSANFEIRKVQRIGGMGDAGNGGRSLDNNLSLTPSELDR